MTLLDALQRPACAFVEDARAFHRAAEQEGSHLGAPAALESLRAALQVLSAAWYRLAADAFPDRVERERALRSTSPSPESLPSPSRESVPR